MNQHLRVWIALLCAGIALGWWGSQSRDLFVEEPTFMDVWTHPVDTWEEQEDLYQWARAAEVQWRQGKDVDPARIAHAYARVAHEDEGVYPYLRIFLEDLYRLDHHSSVLAAELQLAFLEEPNGRALFVQALQRAVLDDEIRRDALVRLARLVVKAWSVTKSHTWLRPTAVMVYEAIYEDVMMVEAFSDPFCGEGAELFVQAEVLSVFVSREYESTVWARLLGDGFSQEHTCVDGIRAEDLERAHFYYMRAFEEERAKEVARSLAHLFLKEGSTGSYQSVIDRLWAYDAAEMWLEQAWVSRQELTEIFDAYALDMLHQGHVEQAALLSWYGSGTVFDQSWAAQ